MEKITILHDDGEKDLLNYQGGSPDALTVVNGIPVHMFYEETTNYAWWTQGGESFAVTASEVDTEEWFRIIEAVINR